MSKDDRAYDKIAEAAVSLMRDELSWLRDEAVGDSPIERLFAVAMTMVGKFGCLEYRGVMWADNSDHASDLMGLARNREFIVGEAQKQLPGWRVDFVFHAYSQVSDSWRQLVVECDGHDFHERTKEQAKRDRSRDRAVQSMGRMQVYRFTGSEIWNNAWACAVEVYGWAAGGL